MNIDINGVTLLVDFMDADFMEKFEPALHEMRRGINESKNMKDSVAASYRALNQAVEIFFNTVWGDESSDRIFGGSNNVMVHLQAVSRINDAYKADRKQFNDFSNKYTQRQQNGIRSMQGHKPKQKRQNGPT